MISVEAQGKLAVLLILARHGKYLDPTKPAQRKQLDIALQCFVAGYGACQVANEYLVSDLLRGYAEVHTS